MNTNKIDLIKAEVVKLKSNLVYGACSYQITMETHCKEEAYNEVLAILDTMQEESVNVWHDTSKEIPTQGSNILMVRKEEEDTNYPPIAGCFHGTNSRFDGRNWGYYNGFCYNEIEPPVKWAYVDELLKLDNPCSIGKDFQESQVKESAEAQHVNETCKENGDSLTQEPVSEELEDAASRYAKKEYNRKSPATLPNRCKGCYAPLTYAFKAGAKWQKAKYESTTEDLGDYINELSKQFPEVSFAKLSRIAVRVAKWQKENLWKSADGDDLPEIDREVIALTQPYPNDEHLRVVFAHRPNKYANVWNSDLGEEQVVEIERHGKGGWNQPNVKWWLDCSLPNMEED